MRKVPCKLLMLIGFQLKLIRCMLYIQLKIKTSFDTFHIICRDLDTHQDPQANTVSDVYRYDQYEEMCRTLLERPNLADAMGL